jgi:hypothetical protein
MEKNLTIEKDIYISKVIKEGDDFVMLLHPDILKRLSLSEDNVYMWYFNDDGSVSLKPTNIKSQI